MVSTLPLAAPSAEIAGPAFGAAAPRRGSWRLALPLAAGALAIVLAGVDAPVFDLERHAVPKALALHTTALLCLPWLLVRSRRIAPGIVELLLAAFLVQSAVSALFAANRWIAFHALAISASGFILLLAGRQAARSPAARNVVLTALGAAAALAAFLGAAQAYGLQLEWLAEERAPGGTFGNRNFLAHLIAIAMPILMLGAVRIRSTTLGLLPLAGVAIGTGAIVLTRSRAAWLAMAVSFGVMLVAGAIARRFHPGLLRRRRGALLVAIMGLGALLAVSLPNRLDWRSDAPYAETLTRLTDFESGSGRGRIVQWRNSLSLAAGSPILGVGPGNWFVHYPRVTQPGDPSFAGADPIPTNPWPSSDWVATLVERGVPGAVLLLLAGVAASIVAATRIVRRPGMPDPVLVEAGLRDGWSSPDGSTNAVTTSGSAVDAAAAVAARAVAFLGMLAAAAVAGAFDAVLLLAAPTFFLWSAAGLLLPGTAAVVRVPPARRGRVVVGALVLLQLVVVGLTAGQLGAMITVGDRPARERLLVATRFDPGGHRIRLLLARRGTCAQRLPHARAAARLMPYHDAPRRALAACGVHDP